RCKVELPLAGEIQALNAITALGLAIKTGVTPDKALEGLTHLQGVPGRMQLAGHSPTGAPVFIDFAHTPDGLETLLRSLRPHTQGALVIVFGCGGDRDKGKRPKMGEIAARLADRVIVTDDNPRTENAASIRRQVLRGCPEAREIGDRREAIAQAIGGLEEGDCLVIAGKGHEQGQIVGKTVIPFSDLDVARELLLSGAAE
ncbi:MAG TPA: UDP-N-acetylmuramoyl-L-alanyl-D-glutamate--2,6-diaminopimelate ligase, partial [Hellea balneolensis]|nr:UDP-N-acetylmuramoyl-L-alanyl-D-glutamate--2,6-diaminopimelate ligase [Hellea balneolensis]